MSLITKAVQLLAVLPNYCVNLARNGVAVARGHFISPVPPTPLRAGYTVS